MGKLTDRYGSRWFATGGIAIIMLSVIMFYFVLTPETPYTWILLISGINGVGSGMFWPSNTSAIMSSAPKGYFGSVSGLSRTLGNVGIILSYVITLSVAAAAIPKEVAFKIFLGTSKLDGGLSSIFVVGLHYAFLISAVVLAVATFFSFLRGKRYVWRRKPRGAILGTANPMGNVNPLHLELLHLLHAFPELLKVLVNQG